MACLACPAVKKSHRPEIPRKTIYRLSTYLRCLARLKEKLEKLTFDVQTNEVKAPLRGIVKQLRVATKGGVVKAGEPLVEITPLDGECELTVTHIMAPSWSAYAERAAGAWRKMLDVLAGTLGPGET